MPRTRKVKSKVVPAATTAKGRKRKAETKVEGDQGKIKIIDEPSTSTDQEATGEIKKVTFSGTVPVDENCTLTDFHVYIEKYWAAPFAAYNATLNQTHIGANNNKYYILQVLERDHKYEYATWFRWGRVGKVAGTDLKMHGGNLRGATAAFEKKFKEKTGNDWTWLRNPCAPSFRKQKGKYDLLEMDYGEMEEKAEKVRDVTKSNPVKKEVPSKLDPRVQDVIDLIFNIKEFEASVKEMEFDIKKAPLGKLTTNQIKAGYEALKKIEKCIQKGQVAGPELVDACSEFYTRIPHDFGMKRPPLIITQQQLKSKIELLETLADIQIAIQAMDENEQEQEESNIKDRHYEYLDCKLEPCDRSSDDFELVEKYVDSCRGSPRAMYYDLAVENVYKVERKEDEERFKDNIGNKMLLWHGSRLTNWCGILKQGLRIAPPEAPVSGYMFGKGVYFADMVTKSASYCRTSVRQPHGFLLLCEVALGKTNDITHADCNADRLPRGKSSTKGMGSEIPNPKSSKKMKCGTTVPVGKPVSASNALNCILAHNEFIVYDVAQIKARYLVKLKFNFKHN